MNLKIIRRLMVIAAAAIIIWAVQAFVRQHGSTNQTTGPNSSTAAIPVVPGPPLKVISSNSVAENVPMQLQGSIPAPLQTGMAPSVTTTQPQPTTTSNDYDKPAALNSP